MKSVDLLTEQFRAQGLKVTPQRQQNNFQNQFGGRNQQGGFQRGGGGFPGGGFGGGKFGFGNGGYGY